MNFEILQHMDVTSVQKAHTVPVGRMLVGWEVGREIVSLYE